ncbi:unnamed protein product [Ciceribacter selenitireducens ATCC BAA-1503]|uniref:Uncharacterized protein n=1 Tax=Ciceribacter selenitireducens ATCC BAA-1503 TaxID=1336235 RepID=A0A376ABM7_9HYPH|nr:unnamed protein product [Ciceribacter selenitireducens ATCC BAA-1503]
MALVDVEKRNCAAFENLRRRSFAASRILSFLPMICAFL